MVDRTLISLYSTADFDEQQVLQVAHDFRIGPEGLTLGGRFTYAWTDPDVGIPTGTANLTARTLFASAEASSPFIRPEERRVGQECVWTVQSRWSLTH